MLAVAASFMVVALLVARSRLAPRFRARNNFELLITVVMIACSVVAVLTTLGIVASLVFEASRFFAMVPVTEFLFGLALGAADRDPRRSGREAKVHSARCRCSWARC